MKSLHTITFILLIIGGLNWGLKAFDWDVVDKLGSNIAMIIYILIGLSAIYEIVSHKGLCRQCAPDKPMTTQM